MNTTKKSNWYYVLCVMAAIIAVTALSNLLFNILTYIGAVNSYLDELMYSGQSQVKASEVWLEGFKNLMVPAIVNFIMYIGLSLLMGAAGSIINKVSTLANVFSLTDDSEFELEDEDDLLDEVFEGSDDGFEFEETELEDEDDVEEETEE